MDENNKDTRPNQNTTEQEATPASQPPTIDPSLIYPEAKQTGDETANLQRTFQPTKNLDQTKPQKRFVVGILTLIFILLLAGGTVFALNGFSFKNLVTDPANGNQKVASLGAAIQLTEGSVQYSTDGLSWTDAAGGESILEGYQVRTLADSRAVLLIDDGSAVRLDSNSQIELTISDTSNVEILLIDGQVYSRVIEDSSRLFAVVTNKERFEALGTAYKTSTSKDSDNVEVYQSKVKVDSTGTEVGEGNKYSTKENKIEAVDIEKLEKDAFIQWNKEEDSKDDVHKNKLGVLDIKEESKKKVEEEKEEEKSEPTPAPAPTPTPSAKITLSGSQYEDDGIKLKWSTSNLNSSDGFKIVYDKSDSTPSYKENSAQYVGSENRDSVVKLTDGKSYYFRVCAYRAHSSSCDTYSNSVKITAPVKEIEAVESGNVTLSIDGQNISWTFSGTAPHGFKVVLSEDQNPVYPNNSIKYVSPGTTSISLPEKPNGTYYVRVCKYTDSYEINGGCTDYSNQVSYIVAE